jgi:hypothetical protein
MVAKPNQLFTVSVVEHLFVRPLLAMHSYVYNSVDSRKEKELIFRKNKGRNKMLNAFRL